MSESLQFAASRVVAGEQAKSLLAELKSGNELFKIIDGTANTHFIVFDLTTIGRASQHAGETKYILASAGIEQALPTLISKPIHVTKNYDAHFEANGNAKAIGVFLGGVMILNEDGTQTLRAVGTLWRNDFPNEVEDIQANIADLGASYEVTYPLSAAAKDGNIVTISQYEFSGGAILQKRAAAHPETKVIEAKGTSELGGEETVTKKSNNTAQPKGKRMKYAGIPEELEVAVDAYVANAVANATKDLQTKIDAAQAEVDSLKTAKDAADAAVATAKSEGDTKVVEQATELTTVKNTLAESAAKAEALTAELAAATTELDTFRAEKVQAEAKAKVDATWTKIKSDWNLEDSMREKKEPLLMKLAEGKEALTPDEFKELVSGGKTPVVMPVKAVKFPLVAGGTEGTKPSTEEIAKLMPAAVMHSTGRAIYR